MGGRVATIRGESKWPEAGFPAKEGKNQSGAMRESGARRRGKEVEETLWIENRQGHSTAGALSVLWRSQAWPVCLFSGTLAPIVNLLPCPPQNNDVAA